ncbi:RNA polymerase sigma factor [Terriglobus roseus]|uniref:RNA polymerase sigma factor, sigma-70 family n=1 Tax=Terriglobus roseus TaxID=392734 RepID=A0A1G7G583_9BACT|nr:sigma-70 family RNA polymerase sigma factor [Terriglobus roseus]SDE83273.1 RNA polymerase sigma factor, sigma-70 family [Terriglobus roseus]
MANLGQLHQQYSASMNDLLKEVRHIATKSHPQYGEDIAQQVMLFVWENLPQFNPDGKPKAFERWCSTVIRRKRFEALEARLQHTSSEGMMETAIEDDSVHIDISGLPEDIREVAQSFLDGYSIRETAARLNLKEGTLRKRLHAFRNR